MLYLGHAVLFAGDLRTSRAKITLGWRKKKKQSSLKKTFYFLIRIFWNTEYRRTSMSKIKLFSTEIEPISVRAESKLYYRIVNQRVVLSILNLFQEAGVHFLFHILKHHWKTKNIS